MFSEVKGRRAKHFLFLSSFLVTVVLAIVLASTGYTGTDEGSPEAGEKGSYTVYGVEIPV